MEVPSESFHRSSWDSRTCYPRRAFNQKTTDGSLIPVGSMVNRELDRALKNARNRITVINDFLTVTSLEKIPWEGEFTIRSDL